MLGLRKNLSSLGALLGVYKMLYATGLMQCELYKGRVSLPRDKKKAWRLARPFAILFSPKSMRLWGPISVARISGEK